MRKNIFNNQKGFTLMEVMVAVSVFTIIVTVGIVSLLVVNNTYKKSQIERQVVDNIGFTLESMSRSLRTAQSWDSISNTQIDFTDQDGIEVSYVYNPNNGGFIERTEGGGNTVRVTTEDLEVEEVIFTESGGSGGVQHYLQIQIRGIMKNGQQEAPFSIQTGVSKRALDVL